MDDTKYPDIIVIDDDDDDSFWNKARQVLSQDKGKHQPHKNEW